MTPLMGLSQSRAFCYCLGFEVASLHSVGWMRRFQSQDIRFSPSDSFIKKVACVARLDKWINCISDCLKSRLLYFTNRKDILDFSPVIYRAKRFINPRCADTCVIQWANLTYFSLFKTYPGVLSFPLTSSRKYKAVLWIVTAKMDYSETHKTSYRWGSRQLRF